MGKATIISHQGSGLYRVQLDLDRASIEAQKGRLTDSLAKLELDTEAKKAALDDAEEALVIANSTYITTQNDSDATDEELKQAREAVERRRRDVYTASGALAVARSREDEARKRLATLQTIPDDPEVDAWCADLTLDLSGEVGTIEIPGEGIDRVIIQPGYQGAAAYTPARDGIMSYRLGQTPEQAFFNAAILPGWQRHKPTYRVGRLDAKLIGGWGRVVLKDEESSAQDLNINERLTGNVVSGPITYMDCNSAAFNVNDDVVVKFNGQDWDDPEIIGFVSNPKSCGYTNFVAVFQLRHENTTTHDWFSIPGSEGGTCNPVAPGPGGLGVPDAYYGPRFSTVLVANSNAAKDSVNAESDVANLVDVEYEQLAYDDRFVHEVARSADKEYMASASYSTQVYDDDTGEYVCTSPSVTSVAITRGSGIGKDALLLTSDDASVTLSFKAYRASWYGIYRQTSGTNPPAPSSERISDAIDSSGSAWTHNGILNFADLPTIHGRRPKRFVKLLDGDRYWPADSNDGAREYGIERFIAVEYD